VLAYVICLFFKIIGKYLDCFIGLVVSNVHSYYLLVVSCFWWAVLLLGDLLMASRCHFLFYFTSYVLNMFRTLIYPSSGACDYSVGLPHWSYYSVKTEDLALA